MGLSRQEMVVSWIRTMGLDQRVATSGQTGTWGRFKKHVSVEAMGLADAFSMWDNREEGIKNDN